MRFHNGYVKIYRSLLDGDLAHKPMVAQLFVNLILMANWQERKFVWRGQQITLKPGSVVCGMKEFSDRWSVAVSTVHSWFAYLQKTERICFETGNRGTLVTILNYETYQDEEEFNKKQTETNLKRKRNLAENQPKLNEEGKKERIKNNIIYTPEFEKFWSLYPKRVGKSEAYKAFQKFVFTSEVDTLYACVYKYRADLEANNTDPKFIKHPATFLRDRRWLDWAENDAGQVVGLQSSKSDPMQEWLDERKKKGLVS